MLYGDVDNAICLHAFYYAIWKRFGALPERYNWQLQAPDVLFYPLRPELVESTYLLYQVTALTCQAVATACQLVWNWAHFMFLQATKNPFYLHVGMDILQSLEKNAKVRWESSAFPWRCPALWWCVCLKVCCHPRRCGYATLHHVVEKSKEDRMESFFLSETCKYLYLVRCPCNPQRSVKCKFHANTPLRI